MSKPLQVAVNVVAFSLKTNQLCVLLVNEGTQGASWQIPESLIDIEQDHSLTNKTHN